MFLEQDHQEVTQAGSSTSSQSSWHASPECTKHQKLVVYRWPRLSETRLPTSNFKLCWQKSPKFYSSSEIARNLVSVRGAIVLEPSLVRT